MNQEDFSALVVGVMLLFLIVILLAPATASWSFAPPRILDAGTALWKGRTYEVFLQGVILLAGVMAILLLLGLTAHRGDRP